MQEMSLRSEALTLRAESLTLRAEVLCAELLANGLAPDRLVVTRAGSFRKRYSRDIETVKMDIDANDPQGAAQVQLTINRDSIYDLLPEGLFHQPTTRSTGAGLREIIGDMRRQKEEEKQARLFFQPLEMELLQIGVAIEQAERAWLTGLPDRDGFDRLLSVWGLPTDLPYKSLLRLTRILPWLHLIQGDLAATGKVLELLLGMAVSTEQCVTEWQEFDSRQSGTTLGDDTIMGESFAERGMTWHFRIVAADTSSFLPESDNSRLLETFCEWLIPLEIDVFFDFAPVSEPATTPILGYGTFL